MSRRLSDYQVVKVTDDYIYVVDLNLGGLSVTNDAERVVREVVKAHGDRRIVYRDSEGNWDELLHDGEEFTGFSPTEIFL